VSDEWIAVRLAALCARPDRRVSQLRFHDHAVRTALLIDLANRKRLTRYAQETHIDTTPTGFAPADRLLAHIESHPDDTMRGVLSKARVRMLDIADTDRTNRSWRRLGFSFGVDDIAAERDRVTSAAQGRCDSPETAALTLIADTLQLVSVAAPGSLLSECAGLGWLVEDGVAYLTEVRRTLGGVASGGGGA
jgi:hypothetical protein